LTVTAAEVEQLVANLSEADTNRIFSELSQLQDMEEQSPLAFYKPHSKQKIFHNSAKKIRLFLGGNMSGKTVAGAKEAVCWLLGSDMSGTTKKEYRKPPVHGWAGAPNLESAVNVLNEEVKRLLPKGLYKDFKNANNTLFLTNGSKLTYKSYDSDVEKWQSAALDFLWFDEQPPFPCYLEGVSRVNRRAGSIWITMTPKYANSAWTYEELYYNRSNDPEIECFEADYTDNIYLTKEMIERQRVAYEGTEDEDARLHGKYIHLAGLIHPKFSVDLHIIDPIDLTDADGKYKKEFSYARVIDVHPRAPNVCNWFAFRESPPIVYAIDELAMQGVGIEHFGRAVIDRTGDMPLDFTVLDTPESKSDVVLGTSMRMELARLGIAAMDANRNFMFARDRTNEYLEAKPPCFYIFRNCVRTIRRFKFYLWDEWRGAGSYDKNPKEKPKKKDDHEVRNVHYFLATMPPLNEAKAELEHERSRVVSLRGYQIDKHHAARGVMTHAIR